MKMPIHSTIIKVSVVLMAIMVMASIASAETVSISFTPPTENTDGTPLTDLSHYTLKYGAVSGTHTESKQIASDKTSDTVTVQAGHWCFVMTASDLTGNESTDSNEVCTDVLDTTAPATFIIEIVGN